MTNFSSDRIDWACLHHESVSKLSNGRSELFQFFFLLWVAEQEQAAYVEIQRDDFGPEG